MTSADELEMDDLIGNNTNIKDCNFAEGERERERKKTIVCPKKCPKRNLYFFWCLMVMEMIEMKRCAGMWVYSREVASFKR